MMRRYLHGSSTEMADWAEELIKANIPAGYFLMGVYIKNGSAGIKKDPELALRYFRKAADLGNPDAQYYVSGFGSSYPYSQLASVPSQRHHA